MSEPTTPALLLAHAIDPKAFEHHEIEERREVAALQWSARRHMAHEHAVHILESDWLATRDARIREDALGPVRKLLVRWDAETKAAQRRCAYCGRSIVHVEPYRLYAHMDMLSEYVHFDGESFCDGSPDSRRAHPASFQPKDALTELTAAAIDTPARADDEGPS